MTDFLYRAVTKLHLRESKLLVSRGSVRRNGRTVLSAVDIHELEWDMGTCIIIPTRLNYGSHLTLLIEGEAHEVRIMEMIALSGLLKIADPVKSERWRASMAVSIITRGWDCLSREPLEIRRP
jgi:hypothetical protein